jgi:hypothetical protein
MGGVKCLDHFIPPLGMGAGAFFVLSNFEGIEVDR